MSSSSSLARRRRSALPLPFTSMAKVMFSHTRIRGNSARFWKINAVGRLFGPMPAMSLPPILTRPPLGSWKPETVRRMVVLPQPDGPRNEKNSPPSIVTVASRTATKSPKLTVRFWSSMPTPALIPAELPWFRHDRPSEAYAAEGRSRNQLALWNLFTYCALRSAYHCGSDGQGLSFESASPG